MEKFFRKFAQKTSKVMGTPWAFIIATVIIIIWAITGPLFDFSDTWQLVINTSTTIVTFLMVFLIQNTQNRDSKAINIKLDELINTYRQANNELLDLDDLTDEQIDKLENHFRDIAKKSPKKLTKEEKKDE